MNDSTLAVVDADRPADPAVAVPLDASAATELGVEGVDAWGAGYRPNDDHGLTVTDDGRLFLHLGPNGGALPTLTTVAA